MNHSFIITICGVAVDHVDMYNKYIYQTLFFVAKIDVTL